MEQELQSTLVFLGKHTKSNSLRNLFTKGTRANCSSSTEVHGSFLSLDQKLQPAQKVPLMKMYLNVLSLVSFHQRNQSLLYFLSCSWNIFSSCPNYFSMDQELQSALFLMVKTPLNLLSHYFHTRGIMSDFNSRTELTGIILFSAPKIIFFHGPGITISIGSSSEMHLLLSFEDLGLIVVPGIFFTSCNKGK